MKKLNLLLSLICINVVGFGQNPTFFNDFESALLPNVGSHALQVSKGSIFRVANPKSDDVNSSDYVLKVGIVDNVQGRAEYAISRQETVEKKYIYKWKTFHPADMFTDVGLEGVLYNQWKSWPCEAYPFSGPGYEKYDSLICWQGGIFNEIGWVEDSTVMYLSRAAGGCNCDDFTFRTNQWLDLTLEIYWTNTQNGYYRFWVNNVLVGYSDNIKTLFDDFLETTCDIQFATGIYGRWYKTGDATTDTLERYIDDIALYDIDNGYTISSVCPDCELAPSVPTDNSVYKININHNAPEPMDFNNVIISYNGDTSAINIVNTFGQNNGIDIYLWSGAMAGSSSVGGECFPDKVVNSGISWSDAGTYKICLKDLNPSSTYTFKLLGATTATGIFRGTQIWTNDENRDTVLATNNTCNVAELTNLVSDENGDLTINVKSIDEDVPRAYINSIEIVEYMANNTTFIENAKPDELNIYPNPVNDNLFVKGETIPSSIIIYSYDGKKVKYAENTSTVNISDLKKGVYIVLVNMQESFSTIKIIKE